MATAHAEMTGSTHDQRFAEIEENFMQAQRNYRRDLAATKSPEEAALIQKNYNRAQESFFDALEARLSRAGGRIEEAYDVLVTANAEVKKARNSAAQITEIIKLLTAATEAALFLVELAAV